MNLSNEDNLRMNVLLHQDLQAIRIDESKMIVYGLSEKGEAKVPLKANCKDDVYIKQVKELISTHVLGSPGGYPIFLRRWTRMGQSRTHESLERLLLLGESEAIVAVVNADDVTNEVARRAWWAMPTAENARCLLRHDDVVNGEMGKELADFLVEFLPFEEEPRAMIESARLVLQQNLITEDVRDNLWKKGQRKNALLVGFLKALPDQLPVETNEHKLLEELNDKLISLKDNVYAEIVLRLLSQAGQAYLQTVEAVLKKPSNQDVVILLFKTISNYFDSVRPNQAIYQDIDVLILDANKYVDTTATQVEDLKQILQLIPELSSFMKSILILSLIDEALVIPVFSRTDAIGSLMRKKLDHIVSPLLKEISILKGKN
ncbi:MAG: sulfur reduction protein DsrS [Gammaproteobacteria bacterium]|nr:sulfur reduction protein DsrS [Gammaproteobacteria bacterium]MCW9031303.1 sulfur reduction protein DsrS [Gammaproteobacteria bacterium]